jgi:hypothetical protein
MPSGNPDAFAAATYAETEWPANLVMPPRRQPNDSRFHSRPAIPPVPLRIAAMRRSKRRRARGQIVGRNNLIQETRSKATERRHQTAAASSAAVHSASISGLGFTQQQAFGTLLK